MKNLSTLIKFLTVLVIGGGTIGASVAISSAQKNNIVEAEAIGDNDTIRIYAIMKDDWAYSSAKNMYIHVNAPGWEYNDSPQMNMILNDYYEGLFYYDVPSDFNVIVLKGVSGSTRYDYQTVDINKSDVYSPNNDFNLGVYKVIYLEGTYSYGGKRNVSFGYAPCSSAQAAEILKHEYIDSCSTSRANGYNAYPQLKKLFFDCSTWDDNTIVDNENEIYQTTLGELKAALATRYFANVSNNSKLFSVKEENFETTITVASIISLSTIGLVGFVLFKRKSHI